MSRMRLQRALARAGVASRRAAEELIEEGRVTVNGRVASLGQSVDPEGDTILVDRKRVRPVSEVWLALNKPLGYVVSRRDPRGRKTIYRLLPPVPGLIYVGRLDVMTGGLLLLTTEGKLAHRLTHPSYEVERSYRARVHGRDRGYVRRALDSGVVIDGRKVRIIRSRVSQRADGGLTVDLTLTEGRNRIVRRLCDKLGLEVEHLMRLSYGPIGLGRLKPGEWRNLSPREIGRLHTVPSEPGAGNDGQARNSLNTV